MYTTSNARTAPAKHLQMSLKPPRGTAIGQKHVTESVVEDSAHHVGMKWQIVTSVLVGGITGVLLQQGSIGGIQCIQRVNVRSFGGVGLQ